MLQKPTVWPGHGITGNVGATHHCRVKVSGRNGQKQRVQFWARWMDWPRSPREVCCYRWRASGSFPRRTVVGPTPIWRGIIKHPVFSAHTPMFLVPFFTVHSVGSRQHHRLLQRCRQRTVSRQFSPPMPHCLRIVDTTAHFLHHT